MKMPLWRGSLRRRGGEEQVKGWVFEVGRSYENVGCWQGMVSIVSVCVEGWVLLLALVLLVVLVVAGSNGQTLVFGTVVVLLRK